MYARGIIQSKKVDTYETLDTSAFLFPEMRRFLLRIFFCNVIRRREGGKELKSQGWNFRSLPQFEDFSRPPVFFLSIPNTKSTNI